MHSCIYEGRVRHHRMGSVTNRFTFPIYLLMLDLDELQQVFRRRWLWSTRGFSFAWFRQQDHFVDIRKHDDESLRWLATKVLAEHGITEPLGSIRLLTQLRYVGFAMNPVSFFYCYAADGNSLRAIITEVNNTPWGEQHLYVIDADGQQLEKTVAVGQLQKEFHVSPFMPMDMQYAMRYTRPGETLAVHMENFQQNSKTLDVMMWLRRREITGRNLASMLARYPLISFQVFAGIYWQAWNLYRKKCRFFPHPKSADKPRQITGTGTPSVLANNPPQNNVTMDQPREICQEANLASETEMSHTVGT